MGQAECCTSATSKNTRGGQVSYNNKKKRVGGKQRRDPRARSDSMTSYETSSSKSSSVAKDDFYKVKVIGRGSYGKVYLV